MIKTFPINATAALSPLRFFVFSSRSASSLARLSFGCLDHIREVFKLIFVMGLLLVITPWSRNFCILAKKEKGGHPVGVRCMLQWTHPNRPL